MTEGRYLTRKNKEGRYDIYLSGFCPMYCGTYDTKEECKEYIKNQKKYYKEQGENEISYNGLQLNAADRSGVAI